MTPLQPRPEHAAGNELQDELVLADDDRVPGVMPAGVARHGGKPLAEHVHDLSLALVAPLGAQHHSRFRSHRRPDSTRQPAAAGRIEGRCARAQNLAAACFTATNSILNPGRLAEDVRSGKAGCARAKRIEENDLGCILCSEKTARQDASPRRTDESSDPGSACSARAAPASAGTAGKAAAADPADSIATSTNTKADAGTQIKTKIGVRSRFRVPPGRR